jgi:hypothetical protein
MTGTLPPLEGSKERISRNNSKPSLSGIAISERTRSG